MMTSPGALDVRELVTGYQFDDLGTSTEFGNLPSTRASVGAGASLLFSAVVMLGGLGATSIGDQYDRAASFAMVGATSRGELGSNPEPVGAKPVEGAESRSDREEIAWIKAHSGLTWDQLGKVFGVSRRAVHMWANGGRLNESNARRLRSFSAIVRDIEAVISPQTPEMVRARLLQVEPDGLSIVDRLRRDRSAGPTWGAPFGPERLVDAIREPLRTQTD
ncbi:hypothetical protein [Nocardia sp. NPDC059239]|uniref:hypothetical protein n=1 Tax=unclassified Nocardia TaxID=2637762 RepID=UPI00367C507C